MDLSKLKVEVYDLLGLIIPGLIVISETWIALSGWKGFTESITALTGTGFTLLLIVSFGFGHIVQELADRVIKYLKGSRYFKQGRDTFWASQEAKLVKAAITKDLGAEITSVDAAFDLCLSKIGDRFPKRDSFIATSDLCRSYVILACIAVVPLLRVVIDERRSLAGELVQLLMGLSVCFLVAFLSWTRMSRFRELSESTVFRIYLACCTPMEQLRLRGRTTNT